MCITADPQGELGAVGRGGVRRGTDSELDKVAEHNPRCASLLIPGTSWGQREWAGSRRLSTFFPDIDLGSTASNIPRCNHVLLLLARGGTLKAEGSHISSQTCTLTPTMCHQQKALAFLSALPPP